MAETRKRIQVLGLMAANYQTMLGFVTNASADADRATNLAALIENLERSVPELSAAAHSSPSNIPLDPSRAPSSLVGMISRVSALAREERVIDGVIDRTDALHESVQNMGTPSKEYFRKQFSMLSWDATSLGMLQQQQSRLTGLVAEGMTASPAIGALLKQKTLLKLYRTHLTEWRSEVHLAYRAAWRTLLVRVGLLCAVTLILFGIHVLVRRLTYREVHDFNTRHMFLVGQRVLLWLLIVAIVLFAFAFDLSSIATFLGLLSAGLAVGFRDAFLAIGGYLVIVRKCHVRVGHRVEISGVAGEVMNLGLLQFELQEIDPSTDRRTGRVVFFSNSLVFVSPATPFFRQLSAPT
jgi:Mechanosensitive ion channel